MNTATALAQDIGQQTYADVDAVVAALAEAGLLSGDHDHARRVVLDALAPPAV